MIDQLDPSVSAILLFGSRARGDNGRGSDTDILLVGPPDMTKHKAIGSLSMFFYPWKKLVADACRGDLFVCHIVQEARPVFDPQNRLEDLRLHFRLRASYALEIAQARDFGWFLEHHGDELSSRLLVRRMIWCIRTVLIAQSAERGTPEFAPSILAAAAPPIAAKLIAERHRYRIDAAMRQQFSRYMAQEGGKPPLGDGATIVDYRALFLRTGNKVGVQTIDRGLRAFGDEDEAHYR